MGDVADCSYRDCVLFRDCYDGGVPYQSLMALTSSTNYNAQAAGAANRRSFGTIIALAYSGTRKGPIMTNAKQIEQRIEQLEALARVLDAQVEHNESARDQTHMQIKILKQSLAEKRARQSHRTITT